MNLSFREKIGQRLVVGFPGTEIDEELEELIRTYKVGNFILFKHNIIDASHLRNLCERLQELSRKHTGHSAFITVDQEGGMVTRLGEDCVNIPGAMALAALNSEEKIYKAGKITGEQLRTLGINFNLAPVADVNSNMDNPVIGVRSYGDDPMQVARYSTAMMKGLVDGGVLASAKHFPGHGDTNVDSHLGLPQVNKTLEEMKQCELVPFQALIEAGIPAITTSHIIFPVLEKENLPATMSRSIITGLLKESLGFQGLVISDCMEMSAIQKYYGTIEGIKNAIKAGVDLIFVSHTMHLAREASDVLTKMLENGELAVDEMDASIRKILDYKEKYIDASLIINECYESNRSDESNEVNESIELHDLSKHDESIGHHESNRAYESNITHEFDVVEGIKYSNQLLKESLTPVQMPKNQIPKVDQNTIFLGCLPFRATNILNQDEGMFHFAEYMARYFHAEGILTSPSPTTHEIESLALKMEEASSVVIATYNAHLYKEQLQLVNMAAQKNQNVIVFAMRNPYDLKDLPSNVFGIAAYEYTRKSLEILAEYLEAPFDLKGKLPIKM